MVKKNIPAAVAGSVLPHAVVEKGPIMIHDGEFPPCFKEGVFPTDETTRGSSMESFFEEHHRERVSAVDTHHTYECICRENLRGCDTCRDDMRILLTSAFQAARLCRRVLSCVKSSDYDYKACCYLSQCEESVRNVFHYRIIVWAKSLGETRSCFVRSK